MEQQEQQQQQQQQQQWQPIALHSLPPPCNHGNDEYNYPVGYFRGKSVWGPIQWLPLHISSFVRFPEDNEEIPADLVHKTRLVVEYYGDVMLPCAICRAHYNARIAAHPLPTPLTRDSFSRWAVDLHNSVSASLGKPELPYEVVMPWFTSRQTLDQAKAQAASLTRPRTMTTSSSSSTPRINRYVLIVGLALLLLVLIGAAIALAATSAAGKR